MCNIQSKQSSNTYSVTEKWLRQCKRCSSQTRLSYRKLNLKMPKSLLKRKRVVVLPPRHFFHEKEFKHFRCFKNISTTVVMFCKTWKNRRLCQALCLCRNALWCSKSFKVTRGNTLKITDDINPTCQLKFKTNKCLFKYRIL